MIETVGQLISELTKHKNTSKVFLRIWLEGRLIQVNLPVIAIQHDRAIETVNGEQEVVFLEASEHTDMRDTMP
jgi:hypothetical protein